MLEETGMVLSVSPDWTKIALVRSEACGSCAAKSMCHSTSEGLREMNVQNSIGAKPGERVVITLPPEDLLKASVVAYLYPTILMVAGAAVGWSIKSTNAAALVGALAGFLASCLYLYFYSRGRKTPHGPAISKILN